MKPPHPPDTPRGGVHSKVDVASLAERAKDESHDAKKISMHADDLAAEALMLGRKHADIIETIPALHVKLDLALRPRPVHPLVQAAIALGAIVGAFALVAIAIAVANIARPSSSASVLPVQAVYRIP